MLVGRSELSWPKVKGVDRTFIADNARELARMRALIGSLSDAQLGMSVNEYWTIAGVLGHMAFWDGRALFLAGQLSRGEPSGAEPEEVDWINDSSRPLILAIAPRRAADVALQVAEKTDAAVTALSTELIEKLDDSSPLNPVRADHRGEHLDEIEAALRAITAR